MIERATFLLRLILIGIVDPDGDQTAPINV